MVKDILSLEDSNIRNQYYSSITNFYPDFKLNSPSNNDVNSPLKDSSNNLMIYHQNISGLKGKNKPVIKYIIFCAPTFAMYDQASPQRFRNRYDVN